MAANYGHDCEDTFETSEMGVVINDKKNRFRWSQGDKVFNLIKCLGNYKSAMEYRNVDFNADKVKQYEAVAGHLTLIWGGSPSTNPLSFGISSDQKDKDSEENVNKGPTKILEEEEETEFDALSSTSSSDKLTDDYLASADSPRDQLLLNGSKKDAHFKRDMAGAIRQSNETFATAMQQMSMSIMQVAQGPIEGLSSSARLMDEILDTRKFFFQQYSGPSAPACFATTGLYGHWQPTSIVTYEGFDALEYVASFFGVCFSLH
eukprot:gene12557-3252_t